MRREKGKKRGKNGGKKIKRRNKIVRREGGKREMDEKNVNIKNYTTVKKKQGFFFLPTTMKCWGGVRRGGRSGHPQLAYCVDSHGIQPKREKLGLLYRVLHWDRPKPLASSPFPDSKWVFIAF